MLIGYFGQRIQKYKMNQYSYLLKFIIVGDASVGKSCILTQFVSNRFNTQSMPTVGAQFGSKTLQIGADRMKLQIWDTAGQQMYQSITRSYYRGSIGAILVYDITSRDTFKSLSKWLVDTQAYSHKKTTVIIVGNKTDLYDKREVSREEGQKFAQEHGLTFMECSAKQSTAQIFAKLCELILDKIENKDIDPTDTSLGLKVGNYKNIRLSLDNIGKPRGGCCW